MLCRIDVRHAIVMSLKMQSSRSDRSFKQMKGRPGDAGSRASRCDGEDALNLFLPLRRYSVTRKWASRCFHPFRGVRSNAIVGLHHAPASSRNSRGEKRVSQQSAPVDQTVSGNDFFAQLCVVNLFAITHLPPPSRTAGTAFHGRAESHKKNK